MFSVTCFLTSCHSMPRTRISCRGKEAAWSPPQGRHVLLATYRVSSNTVSHVFHMKIDDLAPRGAGGAKSQISVAVPLPHVQGLVLLGKSKRSLVHRVRSDLVHQLAVTAIYPIHTARRHVKHKKAPRHSIVTSLHAPHNDAIADNVEQLH